MYKPKIEITPLAGYQFGGAMVEGNFSTQDDSLVDDLGISGSENLGLILDYTLSNKVQLELSFDRHFTQLNLHDGRTGQIIKLSDMTVDYFQAGALYNWSGSSVQPFIGATIGAVHLNPTENLSDEWRIGAIPMIGVKVFASKYFAIRFQTRITLMHMSRSDEMFCDPAGLCYQHPKNTYMTQIQFGMGLTLGL